MAGELEQELELESVIGFKGSVPDALILHPDQEHLIFPLGCTIVCRNVVQQTQSFLQGHDNQVNCITVSRSGKLLASGQKTFMGFPADIIIWDFEQRMEVHRLSLHKVAVTSLSFSYDELYLASLGGQDDNSLVVWNVSDGCAICGTPAHTDTAHCVRFFNKTHLKLITGGNYHTIVWEFDVDNKKLRGTTVGCGQVRRIVWNVLVDSDDQFAYCGTSTGDILKVDLASQRMKSNFPTKKPFPQGVTCSKMLTDGTLLVGTGEGSVVTMAYDKMHDKYKIKQQGMVLGSVTSLALTQEGTHFFAGTSKSNIYWTDVSDLNFELRNTCHHDKINHVCFPASFSSVFATCSVHDIRVWNANDRKELLRIQVPNTECSCIAFMADGRSLVSGWSDDKIRAFLPQSGRLLYVINDAHGKGVTSLATTSDCGRIISGGEEGEVRVWRLGRGSQVMDASMKEHKSRVYDIKVTKDDALAVSASGDGSCIVWDLATRTRSKCLFDSTLFKSIAFHPDESQLITTGSDRKITYWDTFDGSPIRVLEGSEDGGLNTLSMSKSGSHFVSGGEERLLKLWDYDSGVCQAIGVGHSGPITAAAIAPDQSFIVSCGGEGAILVWKMPEEHVQRCLEQEETM